MRRTDANLVGLAADVVAAYVANNSVSSRDLPDLITSVYAALVKLGGKPEAAQAAPLVPAVPIRKSVTHEAIICLEDGKSFKSLKRHLNSSYGLTPDDYRKKWGLPADYPMIAPAYAERRSALAKSMGLGQQREKSVASKKRLAKRAVSPMVENTK